MIEEIKQRHKSYLKARQQVQRLQREVAARSKLLREIKRQLEPERNEHVEVQQETERLEQEQEGLLGTLQGSVHSHTSAYLTKIKVPPLPPSTSPFDPGNDPVTVESHLEQSSHLMSTLKISMACWMIAEEAATRRKIAAADKHGVPTVTGGGPFEVAVAQGQLPAYLDLCADIGVSRIECGEGFTDLLIGAKDVVKMAHERGLEVQFELGKKHGGAFTGAVVSELIDQGHRWLDAGAAQLVIEARESACGVGVFDEGGNLNVAFADRFVEEFGFRAVVFEAPAKAEQFVLLDYFGPEVQLANVRLEEVLRVEIYRRGLHSDAFSRPNLRPQSPR